MGIFIHNRSFNFQAHSLLSMLYLVVLTQHCDMPKAVSSHGNLTLTPIWNAIALALSKHKNSDTEVLLALIWQSHSNISFTTLECSAPLILSPISLLLDVFHLVLTSKEYAEDKKTPHSFINLDLLSCSLTFSSGDIVTSLYLLFNTMTEFSAWSIIEMACWTEHVHPNGKTEETGLV